MIFGVFLICITFCNRTTAYMNIIEKHESNMLKKSMIVVHDIIKIGTCIRMDCKFHVFRIDFPWNKTEKVTYIHAYLKLKDVVNGYVLESNAQDRRKIGRCGQ